MKRSSFIFIVMLLLVLITPFIILTVSDPYDIAIKNNNSYVSYSTYNKNNRLDRYYQLSYLALLNTKEYINDDLIYNDVNNDFTYIFDDGYILVMSTEFSFILSSEYVKYDINEDTAIGYMIEISRDDMRSVLYTQYTLALISLYLVGTLVCYFII